MDPAKHYCAEGASCSATQGFKWLVSVCVYLTDFSDFYGYRLHRPDSLFPLLSFQLGFSGIPENDEKTSKSYLGEASRRTPFWDPFLSLFSEKVPFFPRRVRPLFASLRRNPARRVNLVILVDLKRSRRDLFEFSGIFTFYRLAKKLEARKDNCKTQIGTRIPTS